MQNRILIEKRERESQRHYYNFKNWLPRYIIWPEYDGEYQDTYYEAKGHDIPMDIQEEWGAIAAQAIKQFVMQYSLFCSVFETTSVIPYTLVGSTQPSLHHLHRQPPMQKLWFAICRWFGFGERLPRTEEEVDSILRLDADFFNWRQFNGHDHLLFLLHRKRLSGTFIRTLHQHDTFDYHNLLRRGIVLFVLGIEEPVIDIAFTGREAVFFSCVQKAASDFNYHTEMTTQHFLSHWIVADKKSAIAQYGDAWKTF